MELARKLLGDPAGDPWHGFYETDPAGYYDVRNYLSEELVWLKAAPQILIATDPDISTTVTPSQIVNIHGAVESGTTLTVNGLTPSIDGQGKFNTNVALINGQLTVTVTKAADEKTFVKTFTTN